MKLCKCGGVLYRHGVVRTKAPGVEPGMRYRCKDCRKCITVRNGIVKGGRQMINDWRMAD